MTSSINLESLASFNALLKKEPSEGKETTVMRNPDVRSEVGLRDASFTRLNLMMQNVVENWDLSSLSDSEVEKLSGAECFGNQERRLLKQWIGGQISGEFCRVALLGCRHPDATSGSIDGSVKSAEEDSQALKNLSYVKLIGRPMGLNTTAIVSPSTASPSSDTPGISAAERKSGVGSIFRHSPVACVKMAIELLLSKANTVSAQEEAPNPGSMVKLVSELTLEQMQLAVAMLKLDNCKLPESGTSSNATDGDDLTGKEEDDTKYQPFAQPAEVDNFELDVLFELLRLYPSHCRSLGDTTTASKEQPELEDGGGTAEMEISELRRYLTVSTSEVNRKLKQRRRQQENVESDSAPDGLMSNEQLERENSTLKDYLTHLESLKSTLTADVKALRESESFLLLGIVLAPGEAYPALKEVKVAYRKAAIRLHPDRRGGDKAKFQELQAAYQEILKEYGHSESVESEDDGESSADEDEDEYEGGEFGHEKAYAKSDMTSSVSSDESESTKKYSNDLHSMEDCLSEDRSFLAQFERERETNGPPPWQQTKDSTLDSELDAGVEKENRANSARPVGEQSTAAEKEKAHRWRQSIGEKQLHMEDLGLFDDDGDDGDASMRKDEEDNDEFLRRCGFDPPETEGPKRGGMFGRNDDFPARKGVDSILEPELKTSKGRLSNKDCRARVTSDLNAMEDLFRSVKLQSQQVCAIAQLAMQGLRMMEKICDSLPYGENIIRNRGTNVFSCYMDIKKLVVNDEATHARFGLLVMKPLEPLCKSIQCLAQMAMEITKLFNASEAGRSNNFAFALSVAAAKTPRYASLLGDTMNAGLTTMKQMSNVVSADIILRETRVQFADMTSYSSVHSHGDSSKYDLMTQRRVSAMVAITESFKTLAEAIHSSASGVIQCTENARQLIQCVRGIIRGADDVLKQEKRMKAKARAAQEDEKYYTKFNGKSSSDSSVPEDDYESKSESTSQKKDGEEKSGDSDGDDDLDMEEELDPDSSTDLSTLKRRVNGLLHKVYIGNLTALQCLNSEVCALQLEFHGYVHRFDGRGVWRDSDSFYKCGSRSLDLRGRYRNQLLATFTNMVEASCSSVRRRLRSTLVPGMSSDAAVSKFTEAMDTVFDWMLVVVEMGTDKCTERPTVALFPDVRTRLLWLLLLEYCGDIAGPGGPLDNGCLSDHIDSKSSGSSANFSSGSEDCDRIYHILGTDASGMLCECLRTGNFSTTSAVNAVDNMKRQLSSLLSKLDVPHDAGKASQEMGGIACTANISPEETAVKRKCHFFAISLLRAGLQYCRGWSS